MDRGVNGRKPLFGRLLALLGGYLALFDATLLHDTLSCLYFFGFVTVWDSVRTVLLQETLQNGSMPHAESQPLTVTDWATLRFK